MIDKDVVTEKTEFWRDYFITIEAKSNYLDKIDGVEAEKMKKSTFFILFCAQLALILIKFVDKSIIYE
jgi:hypothetical protein